MFPPANPDTASVSVRKILSAHRLVYDVRRKCAVFDILNQIREGAEQMKLRIFFECIDRKSAVDAGAAADFLRHQRAEAGKGSVDCLCGSHRFRADEIEKFFFCDRERIFLILRVRNEPGAARKNLTDRTHVGGNMFDTVKDRIVLLTEDQVAVFSHDLHNQLLAADIAEFVQMLELKNKNTLESRLGNGENAALPMCLRSSIQKFGAVIGPGLLLSVR